METRRSNQRVYTPSPPPAHLGFAIGCFLRDFVYRCVTSFFTFLLFCVTATFVFFARFTSTFLSRIKAKIISERGGACGGSLLLSEDGEPLRPILDDSEFDEMFEKDHLFQENPGFKFQFRFDIPEDITRNMEKQNDTSLLKKEQETLKYVTPNTPQQEHHDSVNRDDLLDMATSNGNYKVVSEKSTSGFTANTSQQEHQDSVIRDNLPDMATSISNYMVVSEKNISGFVEKPQAMMVYKIQEAYVVDTDNDLLLDSEELDRKLKARLLSVKSFADSPNSNYEEVAVITDKSIDLENVEGSKQSNPDDDQNGISDANEGIDADMMMAEIGTDHASSKESERVRGDADTKESRQVDNDPLCRNCLVFKEDCDDDLGSDTDSDSLTPTSHDGYSVKSLPIDTDFSDGFLSEGDFPTSRRHENLDQVSLLSPKHDEEGFWRSENFDEELMGSVNIELGHSNRSIDFSDESEEVDHFNKDAKEASQVIDEADLVISRLSSVKHPELEEGDELSDELEDLEIEGGLEEQFIDLEFDRAIEQAHSDLLTSQPFDASKQVSSKQTTVITTGVDHFRSSENTDEEFYHGKKSDEMEEGLKLYEETDPEKIKMKGDCDELDAFWEHQDIIDEISMELLNVRSNKLPTIPEEPQSPYLVYDDLKDWKFDETLSSEKPIDEIQMLYKNYRDSMKKLDILNNQKMHAIDVLKLKIPLQPTDSERPSFGSLLSQSFHRRRSNDDHMERLSKEVRNELEIVYVGQTCLSWEFLWWQYEKSQNLPESDPFKCRQYNQVSYEFQKFQVLIQRFLEDEPFKFPRIPYYVKSRRELGLLLLQVPVIQEDGLNDKKEIKKNGDRVVMIEELDYIMVSCIQVFWKFVKADKSTNTSMLMKGLMGHRPELQDPSDLELMVDIHADLHKKEKKLKDLLRVGNCLVKKFKKPEEDRTSRNLFFSQVDLRLISRVLGMPRITTDQLVWCYKKLSNISFVDRKIHRESSFLLFPCST